MAPASRDPRCLGALRRAMRSPIAVTYWRLPPERHLPREPERLRRRARAASSSSSASRPRSPRWPILGLVYGRLATAAGRCRPRCSRSGSARRSPGRASSTRPISTPKWSNAFAARRRRCSCVVLSDPRPRRRPPQATPSRPGDLRAGRRRRRSLAFAALPWIAAELGFFLDGVPVLGSIFMTGEDRAGVRRPARPTPSTTGTTTGSTGSC